LRRRPPVEPAAAGRSARGPARRAGERRIAVSEQFNECLHDLPDFLGWHMLLSVSALAVGLALSVPLGIAVSRRPRLAELTQGVAGVIQTVPSLALLVLMVPLLGGRTGSFVALILYSILPILANTVIGLRGVDPIMSEAG